ncbi:MAG: acyl-ACP--UDP-N-acetylglucosamine O-acyltransferase [Bdellovibrionota bacterium]
MAIHPTAIIGPNVEIHPEASIEPYVVITGQVKIGRKTKVESFVRIGADQGKITIGEENLILSGACLGGIPQDLSYKGENTELVIGDRNTIREYVTMNLGTNKENGITKVGNDNLIMAYVHIAHDCQIANNVVLANSLQLAGHVRIADYARIGGMVGITQFTRIGRHAYVAADSTINKDIPPFTIAQGRWARVRAANKIGIERAGFSKDEVDKINRAVRALIMGERTIEEAIQKITEECLPSTNVEELIQFIRASEQGIAR